MSDRYTLHQGDCLAVLKTLPDASVDAVVTDPPYGLSFMGKAWDYDVPGVEVWRECLRVLKPGGHLLSFAGTRTQHRMAVAIEDAGFEIRDMIAWVYGSGFPKSLDVSKAIDKAAGAEPIDLGKSPNWRDSKRDREKHGGMEVRGENAGRITAPTTDAARQWQGWGTALKPALEPVTVARKPLAGTVAENVLAHGTGALNVDGCRVTGEPSPSVQRRMSAAPGVSVGATGWTTPARPESYNDQRPGEQLGRWPANLIHDGSDEVVGLFPESGNGSGNAIVATRPRNKGWCNSSPGQGVAAIDNFGDSGSAARFFYCAKASKADRDEGLDAGRNPHPTVKPTDLMRYLCRLVTPPGGVVLDPFMGSGSTGKGAMLEGLHFIGIELEAEYYEIAKRRIQAVAAQRTLDFGGADFA